MLPKFWKSLFTLLNLVLDLIKQIVKSSCSLTSLACSRKFRSCSFGLVYTFLGTSRSCIHPPCFPVQAQPWKPKVCKRTFVVTGKLEENFDGSGFLVMNFYSQLPELHHLTCCSPWDWHVLHFCTDGFPRVSRVRRWRYDPYQRVALGGFSTPCVGSTQRRRLPHTTDLWGVRVRALWRSPLQSDCHCSTTPGPRWLVRLEFYPLGIYYPRGRWVSSS
jgi:hypothetical protein